MKRHLLFVLLLLISSLSFGQQTGEINGRVIDEKGEGIPFANVAVFANDIIVNGTVTDFDGFFTVKPLDAGTYIVKASYLEKTVAITDVKVSSGRQTYLDKIVISTAQELQTVVVEYEAPPVDVGKPETGQTISREEIEKIPKNNVVGIIGNVAQAYQADDDQLVSIAGSRGYGTKYLVDNIDLTGLVEIPVDAIDEVQVLTGGIDASQGDFTGGIVRISTRGPSNTLHGTAEYLTSEGIDPFGYNRARFSLIGPLAKKYKGTDSARTNIGFLLTGDLLYEKDSDPPAIPMTYAKDDVLQFLKDNPYRVSSVGEGFDKNTEFVRNEDLREVKYKLNNDNKQASFFGKVDFKPSLNTNLVIGGQYLYSDGNAYIRTFSMFNYENNPKVYNQNIRGYVKFTQRFTTKQATERKKGFSMNNAFYTIQVDYQKTLSKVEDRNHKRSTFDYGYIGQFETFRQPVYAYTTDSVTQAQGYVLLGYQDTSVTFNPGDKNKILSTYTSRVFDLYDPTTLIEVVGRGGLRNGDFTQSLFSYSMWYNPGVPYTSYSNTNNDQFGVRFDASFDLKKSKGDQLQKHSIEFGFEYQQRTERSYSVGPYGLWELARQNTNLHIRDLDVSNPYILVNGEKVWYKDFQGPIGQYDTITYNRLYNQADQKYFDISLRKKLGLAVNGLDFINLDNIDPSLLTIDMFSPDELLAGGSRRVNTQGYDYYGNLYGKQPAFSDFWYKYDDKNGNGIKDFDEYRTRDIGAYRPIYIAGYLQDRFNIGRVIFRVGVRVDRFDANQKVLRDPYSLYAIRTVEEVGTLSGSPINHPEAMGSGYKVYVNDVQNPTSVTGYRNGDQWYDAEGNAINDAQLLIAGTGGAGIIAPYLVDPTQEIKDDDNFEVDQSFVDYKPQYTAMPRIAFSFPITQTSMFTAHYDVLTQRPFGVNEATPYTYYYMQEIAIDGIIPNPNLKPEKTINYQLGFQQALSDHSAIKISAFYREMRDMMQATKMNFAYPVSYTTYGNIDFGTVKGLTLSYNLVRRVNNFLMNASYTLQFADGTGSSITSQINLVAAGQPNLRTIVPLSNDVRHTFNINFDYRFAEGDAYTGPKIGNSDFLSNFGINLAIRGRTGEPYTRTTTPTPTAMFGVRTGTTQKGTINGSRLPFNFKVDIRIDKDFLLNAGARAKGKRPLYLNLYFVSQNFLNSPNIVGVYSFTGSPLDDGYITSPFANEVIDAQIDPEAFTDQYVTKMRNPSRYSMPRRMQIGAKFKF
jgi:outer membrane receptor protein involved in Fe transport